MTATEALPARLAAFGLSPEDHLVDVPLGSAAWTELTRRVAAERMEGILAVAVGSGAIAVSDAQMEELRRLARSRAGSDLLLERETLRAAKILESAGISFRLLKGASWAHNAYPDPLMRSFGDVDLLVDPARWYDAVHSLEQAGAKRVLPELRPGFDARFGKDATLVTRSGREIDLHRTLVVGPYGLWIDCEDLMSRPPAWVQLGATPVPALDPVAGFLHACYNAVLADDPPRLVALRDVAQMALGADLPAEDVLDLAQRWRGVGVVRRALQLVASHLGLTVADTPVGRRVVGNPTMGQRILLASYRGPGRGYTSQLVAVVAIPGIRARAEYLRALVHPQRAYLEARGLGRMGYVELVVRKLRGPT